MNMQPQRSIVNHELCVMAFRTLGLNFETSTAHEVATRFRSLALQSHPDHGYARVGFDFVMAAKDLAIWYAENQRTTSEAAPPLSATHKGPPAGFYNAGPMAPPAGLQTTPLHKATPKTPLMAPPPRQAPPSTTSPPTDGAQSPPSSNMFTKFAVHDEMRRDDEDHHTYTYLVDGGNGSTYRFLCEKCPRVITNGVPLPDNLGSYWANAFERSSWFAHKGWGTGKKRRYLCSSCRVAEGL